MSQAAQQPISFDIPAGSLQSALVAFAATAKVSLKFESEAIKDVQVPGLRGSLPVAAALERLLLGSGLQAHEVSENVFGLDKVPASPVAPAPQKMGEVQSKDLPTIYVSAAASKDYNASRSSTASRTDTELGQTPQTIDVITRAMLDQQQSSTVTEALRNAPGLTISGTNGYNGQVFLRGMAAPVSVDGTSDGSSGIAGGGFESAGLGMPLAAVQGIEVLKGADAIVAGSPGNTPNFGLVNVALKKPQAESVRELSVEGGSYGHSQIALDLAGALNDEKSLSYRMVAQSQSDGESAAGYHGGDGVYFAPSVAYDYHTGSLTAGAEYQRATTTPPEWTYIDFDGSIATPAKPVGEPSDHSTLSRTSAYLEWKQSLPNEWNLRAKLTAARMTSWSSYYALAMVSDPNGWAMQPINTKSELEKNDLDFSVNRRFQWGSVEHKLVLGGNMQQLSIYGGNATGTAVELGSLLTPLSDYEDGTSKIGNITDMSLFMQDQVHWKDWYLLAALTRSSEWGELDISNTSLPRDDATNPSLGLLYQVNDRVAVYTNARKSFSPQSSNLLFDNSVAPPQEGRSWEIGSKIYLNDDRLAMNVAYFSNKVSNSLSNQPDGLHLAAGFLSQGYEVSVTGDFFTGLRGLLSLSDTRLYSDDPLQPSNQVPRYALRTFLSYDLPWEAAHGWSVGGGLTMRSSYDVPYTSADASQQTKTMDGQLSVDANITYASKAWTATLGVKNLTGQTLYGDWATQVGLPVERDRVTTLTVKFNL